MNQVVQQNWRRIDWPNGALVAVQVLIAFEAFERHSQFTTEAFEGVNPFSLSYGEYGAHVGAWRLLSMLAEEGVTGSVAINGLAAQRHPHVVRAFADAGHELVGHGWANDLLMTAVPDERDVIAQTLDAIESAGGQRPVGWVSPGKMGSPLTEELLLDAGITYTGDDASDDLPFLKSVGSRDLAVVPTVDLASNDLLQWALTPNPPSVIRDSFIATFDAIHDEARAGRPGAIGLVLHCHAAGRPSLLPVVREVIRHCAQPGIWFAHGRDLANVAIQRELRR